MYYKEIRVWVPDEEVLNIRFFKHDRFFVFNYLNKPYIIVAEILGTKNFVGFASDGNIFLLDRDNNGVFYASSALAVFARQLKLCRDFSALPEQATEQADDKSEEKSKSDRINELAEQLKKLDNNAFSDENNFWPKVIKKLEADTV